MKIFILAIAICSLLIPTLSYSDELTLEKKAAIRELLLISGSKQIGMQIFNMISQHVWETVIKSNPDIDKNTGDILLKVLEEAFHEEFVIKESFYPYLYPIYHKHLTLNETKELIQFYKTPIGQKFVSVMPQIMQESSEAAQEWGQQTIIPKLILKLLDHLDREDIKIQQ